MSVKSQFLKKLQARQAVPVSAVSKTEADIAAFRERMAQLQEQMDAWLTGTGLNVEAVTVPVMDLLVRGGAFAVSSLVLHYDERSVKFVPIFLYGQNVTGCVEATFHNGGQVTSLGRLYMRAGRISDWTFTQPEALSQPVQRFDEGLFFGLIMGLLS